MDPKLVGRLSDHGAPWLRYMATLSEAAKSGQTWVVATGDDIGLWDTDSGPVLPLWPTQHLAEQSVSESGGAPIAVPIAELKEKLLPFLIDEDASISLFPNFDDDMLVEPDAVAQDLEDFSAEPIDIEAEIKLAPVQGVYDEWALLESPGVEDEEPEGWEPEQVTPAETTERYAAALAAAAATGALWLLDDPEEDAVVGIVLDDRPGVAVFANAAQAIAYGESVDGDVVARPISIDALIRGWLLVAYGGHWSVAISPDAETAVFVEPTRFALELQEACSGEK
jgi:hypothetical protein